MKRRIKDHRKNMKGKRKRNKARKENQKILNINIKGKIINRINRY